MKKIRSQLMKRDGSVMQEQSMTVDQTLIGLRKLLEADTFETFYVFRRYPLCVDGETLEAHIHMVVED